MGSRPICGRDAAAITASCGPEIKADASAEGEAIDEADAIIEGEAIADCMVIAEGGTMFEGGAIAEGGTMFEGGAIAEGGTIFEEQAYLSPVAADGRRADRAAVAFCHGNIAGLIQVCDCCGAQRRFGR